MRIFEGLEPTPRAGLWLTAIDAEGMTTTLGFNHVTTATKCGKEGMYLELRGDDRNNRAHGILKAFRNVSSPDLDNNGSDFSIVVENEDVSRVLDVLERHFYMSPLVKAASLARLTPST